MNHPGSSFPFSSFLQRGPSRPRVASLLIGALVLVMPAVAAGGAQDDYGSRGNVWLEMEPAERQQVDELSERFKTMIGSARTELAMVREAITWAEENGFEQWDPQRRDLEPGDRLYSVNRGRTFVAWVQGRQPLAAGMRLVNSHIDSVRLELKPHPLKQRGGTVTFDTLQHGGLKGYQWVNVPLALTGASTRETRF